MDRIESNLENRSNTVRLPIARIPSGWLALGTAVALAMGCMSNAASANDAASEQAVARALASEINLRGTDLSGFEVVAGTQGENEVQPGPLPRRVEKCNGGPTVNPANRGVASPLFQTPDVPIQTIVSAVYAMPAPSMSTSYLIAGDSKHGRGCLQREEIRKRAALGRLARGRIEVSAFRPIPDLAAVSGVRVWRCLPGSKPCKRRSDRSFTDRLWFAAGRYIVVLVYIAGPRNEAKTSESVALPVERRIIALLYGRAQAHTR
jgi:hypothetical protein